MFDEHAGNDTHSTANVLPKDQLYMFGLPTRADSTKWERVVDFSKIEVDLRDGSSNTYIDFDGKTAQRVKLPFTTQLIMDSDMWDARYSPTAAYQDIENTQGAAYSGRDEKKAIEVELDILKYEEATDARGSSFNDQHEANRASVAKFQSEVDSSNLFFNVWVSGLPPAVTAFTSILMDHKVAGSDWKAFDVLRKAANNKEACECAEEWPTANTRCQLVTASNYTLGDAYDSKAVFSPTSTDIKDGKSNFKIKMGETKATGCAWPPCGSASAMEYEASILRVSNRNTDRSSAAFKGAFCRVANPGCATERLDTQASRTAGPGSSTCEVMCPQYTLKEDCIGKEGGRGGQSFNIKTGYSVKKDTEPMVARCTWEADACFAV